MPGLIRKVLSSFTLVNFRRLIRFLFRDPPRPRLKDIALFLRLLVVDVAEFEDDELRRIVAVRGKVCGAITRLLSLLDDVDRELAFREGRSRFDRFSTQVLELCLDVVVTRKTGIEEVLKAPIKDPIDRALFLDRVLTADKEVWPKEYVLKRLLAERQRKGAQP